MVNIQGLVQWYSTFIVFHISAGEVVWEHLQAPGLRSPIPGPLLLRCHRHWCLRHSPISRLHSHVRVSALVFVVYAGHVRYAIKFLVLFYYSVWWSSIKCYVRPSVIKIWCPLNNFWKTASIPFIFGMLIYNIKTQVEFDLGYNPLIFWAFYKNI